MFADVTHKRAQEGVMSLNMRIRELSAMPNNCNRQILLEQKQYLYPETFAHTNDIKKKEPS